MTRSTADLSLRFGVATLAAIGVLTAAACSSSGGKGSAGGTTSSASSPASSSSTSPSATSSGSSKTPTTDDLTATLINPADIAVPGDTFTLKTADPVSDASPAVGVDGEFANAAGTRKLTDVLLWFPTDSDADTALTSELAAGKQQIVTGLVDTPLTVGSGGHMYQGADADGPATIVLFQEGNYVVTLEFNSTTAGDDIPAALATSVATAQDSKVKAAS
jgi:hypothetical protein